MKQLLLFYILFTLNALDGASQKDWKMWPLPDSLRAVSLYAERPLDSRFGASKGVAGIQADSVALTLQKGKGGAISVVMSVPKGSQMVASGFHVKHLRKKEAILDPAGASNGTYKLLLVKAFDSAQNFSLFSGYAFLPQLKKWKFIATVRSNGYGFVHYAGLGTAVARNKGGDSMQNLTVFRSNGAARALNGASAMVSPQYWRDAADSSEQVVRDKRIIESAKISGRMPVLEAHEGIYYSIATRGTGKPVSVSDTVTVYYSGRLPGERDPFDATMPGKPARFPLGGLIRGWQIGLPLLNEGGKITLVIPSGLAYATRTRSAKIPPNSILVFDIEVIKVDKQK